MREISLSLKERRITRCIITAIFRSIIENLMLVESGANQRITALPTPLHNRGISMFYYIHLAPLIFFQPSLFLFYQF